MGWTAHDTDLYMIGSGIAYFDRWDADGLPTGFRDLGNGILFAGGVELETKDHWEKRSGLRDRDLRIILSRLAYFNLQLDEYDKENIALQFLGSVSGNVITLLNSPQIFGEFKFVGDPAHGPSFMANLWKVTIAPTGEIDFLSDDWGTMNFRIDINSDIDNHPDNEYGIITQIFQS